MKPQRLLILTIKGWKSLMEFPSFLYKNERLRVASPSVLSYHTRLPDDLWRNSRSLQPQQFHLRIHTAPITGQRSILSDHTVARYNH
jgi:hypothetical protein